MFFGFRKRCLLGHTTLSFDLVYRRPAFQATMGLPHRGPSRGDSPVGRRRHCRPIPGVVGTPHPLWDGGVDQGGMTSPLIIIRLYHYKIKLSSIVICLARASQALFVKKRKFFVNLVYIWWNNLFYALYLVLLFVILPMTDRKHSAGHALGVPGQCAIRYNIPRPQQTPQPGDWLVYSAEIK